MRKYDPMHYNIMYIIFTIYDKSFFKTIQGLSKYINPSIETGAWHTKEIFAPVYIQYQNKLYQTQMYNIIKAAVLSFHKFLLPILYYYYVRIKDNYSYTKYRKSK